MPQRRLLALLRDALVETAGDLEKIRDRLERVLEGKSDDPDEPELDLSQIAALGFLGLIKAQRETGLMLEVAVREGIELTRSIGERAADAAADAREDLRAHRQTVEPVLRQVDDEEKGA